jgi:hypothetical protein
VIVCTNVACHRCLQPPGKTKTTLARITNVISAAIDVPLMEVKVYAELTGSVCQKKLLGGET